MPKPAKNGGYCQGMGMNGPTRLVCGTNPIDCTPSDPPCCGARRIFGQPRRMVEKPSGKAGLLDSQPVVCSPRALSSEARQSASLVPLNGEGFGGSIMKQPNLRHLKIDRDGTELIRNAIRKKGRVTITVNLDAADLRTQTTRSKKSGVPYQRLLKTLLT